MRMANEFVRQGPRESAGALVPMADRIARAFGVQADEVAVLALSQDGRALRFLLPTGLQKIGQINMTSNSSLAARTARDGKAEIINRFSVVPHASVFESVRLKSEPGDPIQKIMSVALTHHKKIVGVIQISRKAKNNELAGADFTPKELKLLSAVGVILGPCVFLVGG